MAERLYYAFDWLIGREYLPAILAFDLALKHEIVVSQMSDRLLANGSVVYRIGISVGSKEVLESYLSALGGDLKRMIPISEDEFNQSQWIFSMNDKGRYLVWVIYKQAFSHRLPQLSNPLKNAIKTHRLLRRKLQSYHIYTMDWNLPQLRWNDPFAQRVNAVVKNMCYVVHEMEGEIACSWHHFKEDNNNRRFYVILPSYKALSLFTLKALPTLPMSIWSEILHEDLPNLLETYMQFGLYRLPIE
jgi:hypothetical protein